MSHHSLLLQMKNIHLSYGDYKALKGVDFDLYAGEIHGLVGEHRAGKSTLVKILSGALRKDQGQILFQGREISHFTPKTAAADKIGMMYQDKCNIIPTMDAVGNIFVGRDLRSWWIGLNERKMEQKAREIFTRIGSDIQLHVPLKHLSHGDQLMVELAKVLSIEPEILIFDEIATRLNPSEMEKIHRLLFEFKRLGKSIIYISHDIDEIFEVADRVTILKDGYRRGTEAIKDLDKVKLIKMTYSFVLSREELERDGQELFLLKKYSEDIIKNLPEGVIVLDPEHRIYLINYAAISILELEDHELLQQHIDTVFSSEAIEHAKNIRNTILSKDENAWEELEYQNGKILNIQTFPFKDDDYRFLGTILIIEDMSKERYFNEYLLRTQKIESVAEVAAGVAHEINNPLGIIQNYVTLLKRKIGERDNLEKLDKVEGELKRIVRIIESLLSFSKLKKLPMTSVNLADLLTEVLLLLNHKFTEKRIHVSRELPEQPALVFGDENKLKQVFMNVLVNSIEAVMQEGNIAVKIETRQVEEYVEVSICDDGYGIPEEIQEKMFDPFFSTKAGKKNTGLGLSICQHIIESHRGLITCDCKGKTSFNIRLPLVSASPR